MRTAENKFTRKEKNTLLRTLSRKIYSGIPRGKALAETAKETNNTAITTPGEDLANKREARNIKNQGILWNIPNPSTYGFFVLLPCARYAPKICGRKSPSVRTAGIIPISTADAVSFSTNAGSMVVYSTKKYPIKKNMPSSE